MPLLSILSALSWLAPEAQAQPVVTPAGALEIAFETDASKAVTDAVAALSRGEFDAAGKQLSALAAAGGNAELHYLAAVAWYEAGMLSLAFQDAADGLLRAPDHAALASLQGLVLADLGRGAEALTLLDAAAKGAGADRSLMARVEINRALVYLDEGKVELAAAALSRAKPHAAAESDAALLAKIADNEREIASLRGLPGSTDPLGKVGELVAKGDLAGARAALPAGATDRRSRARALIAEGVVARAEGKLDAAQRALQEAAKISREGGLVREAAAANAQLGVVYLASNRPDPAIGQIDVALALLEGSSFSVLSRSCHVEAARAALRAGRVKLARTHLTAARSSGEPDPSSRAALAEIEGLISAEEGDSAKAQSALTEAARGYEAISAHMDAARAWTGLIEAQAGVDKAAASSARESAIAAFSRAGDPLGPAHAGIAEGLGLAKRRDLEGAMAAFAAAAKAAEGAGPRGVGLAQIARENAAKTVAMLSGSAVVLENASRWGVEDLVARNTVYQRARAAYDKALVEYQAARYDSALAGFDSAVKDLESIGEQGYARVARRARAWARFNAYTRSDAASGLPVWQALVEEGSLLQDAELRVRAMGAAALASSELGRSEAVRALAAASTEAEAMGLRSLAGQCQAALADKLPKLEERASAARKAYALRDGDKLGIHAVYSVAYAAYEQSAYDTAIDLASGIVALAGEMTPAVRELLDAAIAAKAGG